MEKFKFLLLIACLSIASISSTFANPCCFPAQKGRFNVGIDALYLRPDTDNLTYALLFINDRNQEYKLIDPSYNWGFYAHVGYQFPCSCYDVDLAYTHFNANDDDSVETTTEQGILIIPLSSFNLTNTVFRNAASKAEFNLNAVDLDVGRNMLCNTYNLRLFGGLRYANFDANQETAGITIGDLFARQKTIHNFRGVGPMVGAKDRYVLCGGWGIDAVADMAFLIGQTESKYIAPPFDSLETTFHEVKNSTIPVLEAKLGLDYTTNGCRNNSLLVLEGGYQVTSYFNMLTNLNGNPVTPGTDSLSSTSGPTTNLSFNGLYFGAKYYI